ncbi:MAG: hypothetical protein L7F78_14770, partial [Syntrophales bacterium LBB04]|nr:hypothetical protein [Syntrophales bacterium LBB04]
MTRTCRDSRMVSIIFFSSGILFFTALSLLPLSGTAWSQVAFNPNATTAQEAIDFVVMANRIL